MVLKSRMVKEKLSSSKYTFNPIGIINSCYKEKFGIPRQAGLVTEAKATLELIPPYQHEDIVRELENFSHIWLVFVFHQIDSTHWKPTVRPPRLGGNKRVGVFASRSPYRPNPIGLSLVELTAIYRKKKHIVLELQGCDLLDKTPILDIKPYIPYADSISDAKSAYAPSAPKAMITVNFSEQARQQCEQQQQSLNINLSKLITQILQQDPRPAYKTKNTDSRQYSMKLYDFDLRWHYSTLGIEVIKLSTEEQRQS